VSHCFDKAERVRRALTTTVRAADAFVAGVGVLDTREEGRDPVDEEQSQRYLASTRGTSNILLLGLPQKVLEIEQGLLGRLHIDEGGGNSCLSGTSSTSNLMDIVLYDARDQS
jgi:hypothetical protein